MMKSLLLILLFFSVDCKAQRENDPYSLFLKWFIKEENITVLNSEVDSSLLQLSATKLNTLPLISIDKVTGNISESNKRVTDFLSDKELEYVRNSIRHALKYWKYCLFKLPVIYAQVSANSHLKEFSGLSWPVFLNNKRTKIAITTYFVCGAACGRGDLVVCEYKDHRWQIVARFNIWNS